MKILIATSIFPPDTGGPAHYALELSKEFRSIGHNVKVVTYSWEKIFPSGIKHLIYFIKLMKNISGVNFILALDTFLTVVPALLVGRIFNKKVLVRTGGDFLWEMFVNRTGQDITLSNFYKESRNLSIKEKIIFFLTAKALRGVTGIIFSTNYQKDIFVKAYGIDINKTFIVENCYKDKTASNESKEKNFLWAGRNIKLKNVDRLKSAFQEAKKQNQNITLDIMLNPDHNLMIEKMKDCYAFILPSLSEISPGIILRAISFNKPFICTKETGIYERIKDIGLFIDPLSEKDIKERILFLADDNNYLEQRRKIENFNFRHSYREIANELITIADRNK